jgi:hypothetical protein
MWCPFGGTVPTSEVGATTERAGYGIGLRAVSMRRDPRDALAKTAPSPHEVRSMTVATDKLSAGPAIAPRRPARRARTRAAPRAAARHRSAA